MPELPEKATSPDPDEPPGDKSLKGKLADIVRMSVTNLFKGIGGPLALSTLLLMIWQFYGSPGFFYVNWQQAVAGSPLAPVADHLYWFGTELLLLLVVPLLAGRFIWKLSFREMGLGLGDWRLGLAVTGIFYAVMLPLVLIVSRTNAFLGMYPLDVDLRIMLQNSPADPETLNAFLTYETGYAGMFIGWEYFFRGFLLFSLKPHIGASAIAVQMVPFALLHIANRQPRRRGRSLRGCSSGRLRGGLGPSGTAFSRTLSSH